MKLSILPCALVLAGLSLAQTSPPRFSLVTQTRNVRLSNKMVNANGGQLWINKPTASYCPVENVGTACPAGTTTSFAGGTDTLSMNVLVPGGQQVYVNATGVIKFTQAHSAYMDPGSVTTGWTYQAPEDCEYGHLLYNGCKDFLACGTGGGEAPRDIRVYRGHEMEGCEKVQLKVPKETITSATAWQYT